MPDTTIDAIFAGITDHLKQQKFRMTDTCTRGRICYTRIGMVRLTFSNDNIHLYRAGTYRTAILDYEDPHLLELLVAKIRELSQIE